MVKSSYTSIESSRYWKKVRNTNRLIYIWQQKLYLMPFISNISSIQYSSIPNSIVNSNRYFLPITFLISCLSVNSKIHENTFSFRYRLHGWSLRGPFARKITQSVRTLIWATSAGYCLTTTRQLDFFRETIFLLFFWSCSFTFCQKCMYS